ncbi:ABC transporter permease subunit [Marinospirillum sp. MEB164]|uniref:ABC transporter permease subunit n=1 Tax=Marinospirillum alkalitolerans TaxID=3123374 RepID=A0ABW8PV29_9GAMM
MSRLRLHRATLTRLDQALVQRRHPAALQRRFWLDRGWRALVSAGGLGVLLAISAIFFYLVYVVVPLMGGVQLEQLAVQPVETASIASEQPDAPSSAQVDLPPAQGLAGGQSQIVALPDGRLEHRLIASHGPPLRHWQLDAPAVWLGSEPQRRVFASLDQQGQLSLFYSTRATPLAQVETGLDQVRTAYWSNEGSQLVLESATQRQIWQIHNPHPEVSWPSLWAPVAYEHYTEPLRLWQASPSSLVSEPKFSLAPLTFGTLKAALAALLLALPLALGAALYTAYFLPRPWQRRVKACLEMMEAVPTVILGLIAALLLAPWLEQQLFSLMLLMVILALVLLLGASLLPRWGWQQRGGGLWMAYALGLLLSSGVLTWLLADGLEQRWFGGSLVYWLEVEQDWAIYQLNALVVGMAMGFALIPSLYALVEEALSAVPSRMTQAAMALGATPWQTIWRVLLPLAAPGIVAAVMLALGRAVGETMILLMASGNTPLMGANLLEGLRSLAANMAIEIQEAGVQSTHYRVLFLSALVLFVLTLVANTLAEWIRQGWRRRQQQLEGHG